MVLNPERLVITVDGDHSGDGEYSKFSGDSFELADMQIKGAYRGGQPRTFMYDLYEIIAENTDGYAKQIVNENMQYDRSLHGWWVDWDAIGYEWRTSISDASSIFPIGDNKSFADNLKILETIQMVKDSKYCAQPTTELYNLPELALSVYKFKTGKVKTILHIS